MSRHRLFPLLLSAPLLAFGAGCGGGTSTGNPTVTATEVQEGVLSGAANSTEPNGTQSSIYISGPSAPKKLFAELFTLETEAAAAGACPTPAGTACSVGAIVMDYSSCNFGSSLTVWNGSQSLTFSGGCQSFTLASLNGVTLTRTFGAGTSELTSAGIKTTLDTTTASTSGYNSTITVGSGEQVVFSDGAGSRQLTISGVHLSGTFSGTTLFDHTISSTAATVSGAGTSRTISGGTMTLQHNLARYTATTQITSTLTYSMASCCHPASGQLTTTFSGSQTGTETLNFTGGSTGSCGTTTYKNAQGVSSSLTLSHCF